MPTGQYIRKPSDIKKRFWSKVGITANPDKCWEWQGAISSGKSGGYGSFRINGGASRSHRIAWELTHGAIPDGLWVLHKCDNRKCCNPSHLFLGTRQDNVDDMIQKNRKAPCDGELNGHAKLTGEDVAEIRRLYAIGNTTYKKLAEEFDTSQSNIWYIITGKHWR